MHIACTFIAEKKKNLENYQIDIYCADKIISLKNIVREMYINRNWNWNKCLIL